VHGKERRFTGIPVKKGEQKFGGKTVGYTNPVSMAGKT